MRPYVVAKGISVVGHLIVSYTMGLSFKGRTLRWQRRNAGSIPAGSTSPSVVMFEVLGKLETDLGHVLAK